MNPLALSSIVRQVAYEIYGYLGPGHLEKVYENALFNRLGKRGIDVRQQVPIRVLDEDGVVLGDYVADLMVAQVIVVEVKATRALAPEHVAQILGYLKSTGFEHGILVNFGGARFELRKFIFEARLSGRREEWPHGTQGDPSSRDCTGARRGHEGRT